MTCCFLNVSSLRIYLKYKIFIVGTVIKELKVLDFSYYSWSFP